MSKFSGRLVLFGGPVLILGAFILLFAVLFSTAPEPERGEVEARPVAVFVTEAEARPVQLTVNTQGEVRPLTEISLTAQVSGRIDYVDPNFVQGGFFEAGQTLVRVEDDDYRLAVTRAEALVSQRRQQLLLEEAEGDLAREEWESLGEGEASALTLRQPQMEDARAQLAAAEASLAEARLNLRRTRISAPFDGRVRSKNADLGQFVGAGSELGEVFSTDEVQIRLPLTDAQLGKLGIPLAFQAGDGEGPTVLLRAMLAGEPREWTGHVVRTDSAINPQTRTLYAIVSVEDPYGSGVEEAGAPLAIGLFVDAFIEGREISQAYILPRSALRGNDTVYVAEEDGTLSVRTVSVIDSNAEEVVVANGVEEGERVITSPVRAAADGMPVTPLGPDGEPLDGLADSDASSADQPEGEDSASVASAG